MAEVYAMLHAVQPMPLDLPGFAAACTDHYVTNVADVPARAGALEKVAELAERGVLQACVSNSGRRVVEANIGAIAMPEALRFALSRDDVTHGKPHPEPYLRAAERLGVHPSACIVVEDSPIGARSGKAAGMVTIAWPQHADAGVRPGRSSDRRTARTRLAGLLPLTGNMGLEMADARSAAFSEAEKSHKVPPLT